MDTSWTQQRCPCFFFRKSGSKGVRIQTTVSQSQKMNYCWAELDWNWKTGYSINKEGKPTEVERRDKQIIQTAKKVVEHQIATPLLSKNESGWLWPTCVRSCDGHSPLEGLLWARCIVPLLSGGPSPLCPMLDQVAAHGLHSWLDSRPYVQNGLSPRCHTQCMTTYVLGQKRIQNQNDEVLMPQVCSLLRSEQN